MQSIVILVNDDVLYTQKLLGEQILNILTTKKGKNANYVKKC